MANIHIEDIIHASRTLQPVIEQTPLVRNDYLSELFDCNVLLKREDLQVVRSFKIRGAYNFMRSMDEEERRRGVVCASAGNHAQGVAYSCKLLGVEGKIFMPKTTPRQKVSQVQFYGGAHIEVMLVGDTFDDSFAEAVAYSERENMVFIHPFDHPRIIAGQGTIGMEIMQQTAEQIDYVFAGIGGGGLISGVGTYIKTVSPETRMIGVEPEGAPSMHRSLEAGHVIELASIDRFVDGAAVKKVGEQTFGICREVVDEVAVVPEGAVCTTILDMYNRSAIVVEPAGALSVAALSLYREQIRGKNVVCLISGGNNDIDRMQDIKERSLVYEGLKHYFIVNFPQRAGALREFLAEVLGPTDDITRFEYMKKNNRDNAPAIVGIELKHREDYEPLIERLRAWDTGCIEINRDPRLFNLLI